jgi:hypothetical protein
MEDIYEVENYERYEDTLSPLDMAEEKFTNVYKRNWRLYLDSIEWDTWCTPAVIPEPVKEIHPFEKFF